MTSRWRHSGGVTLLFERPSRLRLFGRSVPSCNRPISHRHTEAMPLILFCRRHTYFVFLLLARYVPNIAKRSIMRSRVLYRPIDDRPTDRPTTSHLEKIQMAISPRRIIRFTPCLVLTSRMGFSGSADRMAIFPVWPNSIGRAYVGENNAQGVIFRLVTI